jgi:hypothetical protein
MSKNTSLTDNQKAILAAIEAGHTTMRAIAKAGGLSSPSVVKSNLERLAEGGHVLLRRTSYGMQIATGRDFRTGWDAAARLAGNSDA